MRTYEFEIWSSLDSKYVIIKIDAPSKTVAVKLFKRLHPHKKYRLIDQVKDG